MNGCWSCDDEKKKGIRALRPKYLFLGLCGSLPENNAGRFDHESFGKVFDPFHGDGVVLGDIPANVHANFAGFASIHGNVSGFVRFAVVDAVGLGTVGGAQVTVGFGANGFVDVSDVIHCDS
jgi:hypothetical protein